MNTDEDGFGEIDDDRGLLASSILIVGRYEIMRPIGRGGMGEVYLARDWEVRGREVALKVLTQRYVGRPKVERRFENEAEYGRALTHHNIARTMEFGRMESGRPYIVMEYVNGTPINVLSIFEDREVGLVEILDLMLGVAEAIYAMHEAGIVHRDLTPANILVEAKIGSFRSVAKVIDFSHAAHAVPLRSVGHPHRLTGAHEAPGTSGYMPPEQACSEPANPRMDVFAFGVVLWELLANRKAFRKIGLDAYLEMQANNPSAPPSLADARSGLPPELYRLVDDCTHVVIASRPSASSIVMRLADILEEMKIAEGLLPRASIGAKEPILMAMLVVAAIIIGLLAWRLWAPADRGPEADRPKAIVNSATSEDGTEPTPSLPEAEAEPEEGATAVAPIPEVDEPISKPRPSRPKPKPKKRERRPEAKAPEAPSAEACERTREAAKAAGYAFEWEAVLRETNSKACWSGRPGRKRLRVMALIELGRFEACAREASGVADPQVVKLAEKCKGSAP